MNPPTAEQFKALCETPPLWLTHYTWNLRGNWWDKENHAVAVEFARVTRAVSLALKDDTDWDAGIRVARQTNAKVAVQWSPYWATRHSNDPCAYLADQARFLGEARRFKERIEALWPGQKLFVLMFDHEVYTSQEYVSKIGPNDILADSNDQLAALLQVFDDLGRAVYPDAAIVWYAAPNRKHGQGVYGPEMDYYAASLYRPYDMDDTTTRFHVSSGQANIRWAPDGRSCPRQAPWITLGSGYHPQRGWWQNHCVYPTDLSELYGQFLRNDADRMDHLWHYPEPGRSRYFWDHILAYARGAQGMGMAEGDEK